MFKEMFKVNFVLILFVAFSCNHITNNKKDNSIVTAENETPSKKIDEISTITKESYQIDTSLVEGLAIWSSLNTEEFFRKYLLESPKNNSYNKIINNESGTQSLRLTHLQGSDEYTYRYIEIFWNTKSLKGNKSNSSIKEFITNSKVKLGMSIDSFCKIKNIMNDQIYNNTYIYNTEIDGLGYHSKYLFDNDQKLEKIEFGYDNP